jgi:nucleotide-binding universal stress UspA family protein
MVIIAAADRSERAQNTVAEAVEIAQAFNDQIDVVHVLTRSQFIELEQTEVAKSGRPVKLDRVREFAAKQAERATEGVKTDAPIEHVGLVGKAADEVLSYATDKEARYIVVGSRNKSPAGKALFGSVSQRILLNSDCPVVVTMQT